MVKSNKLNDAVPLIKHGQHNKAALIIYHHCHKNVITSLRLLGWQKSDAQSFFNDAVLDVIKQVKRGKTQNLTKSYVRVIALRKGFNRKDRTKNKNLGSKTNLDYFVNNLLFSTVFKGNTENHEENLEKLRQALKKLSFKCHLVIRLKYYEVLSHKEIATIMGYKSDAVSRNRLRACLATLREKFFNS